jgi:hypothetical protein
MLEESGPPLDRRHPATGQPPSPNDVEPDAQGRDRLGPISEAVDESRLDSTVPLLANRYRLDELLAIGTSGQDWRGFDLRQGCPVQIKVLKLRRGQDPHRLLDRLRCMIHVSHHGILPTLDAGVQGDKCFVIAPQLDAISLEERLQERPISRRRAITWTIQVAEAIEHAHQRGIVHGELTAACILLDGPRGVRVGDFGISENSEPTATPGGAGRPPNASTTAGPLQVDTAADLRDLGRLLQRLLSGPAKSPSHQTPGPPARPDDQAWLRVSQLPPPLQKICQKAISPDPKKHYKSAGQFAKDLRLFQREHRLQPVRRAMLGGAILLPLLLATWLGYRLLTQNTPSDSGKPPAKFFNQVAKLKAQDQVRAVADMLGELNPGFDGQLFEEIEQGRVVGLRLETTRVSNIWPIAALTSLRDLDCSGPYQSVENGILSDLSPLVGLPIRRLRCDYNLLLEDLSPLAHLPLEYLNIEACKVRDLSPLLGLQLREIVLSRNPINDLSPLTGMPLEAICVTSTLVEDISPVAQAELKFLRAIRTPVRSLEPLRGSQVLTVEFDESEVSDLSPVTEMPQLIGLMFRSSKVTDLSPLLNHPKIRWLRLPAIQPHLVPLLDTLPALELVNGGGWPELRARVLLLAEERAAAEKSAANEERAAAEQSGAAVGEATEGEATEEK